MPPSNNRCKVVLIDRDELIEELDFLFPFFFCLHVPPANGDVTFGAMGDLVSRVVDKDILFTFRASVHAHVFHLFLSGVLSRYLHVYYGINI